MRRITAILGIALLIGAIFTGTAWAQYGKEYSKPVRVYSGADSVYNAAEPDSSTGSGVLDASPTIYIAARGTAYSNWVEISELAVPAFIESYRDTQRVGNTVTRTETRTESTPAHRDTLINNVWIYGPGTPGTMTYTHTDTWAGRDTLINGIHFYGTGTVGTETIAWTDTWAGRDTLINGVRFYGTGAVGTETTAFTDTWAGRDTVIIGERLGDGGGYAISDSLIGYAHTVTRAGTVIRGHSVVVDSLVGYNHTVTRAGTVVRGHTVVVDSLVGYAHTVARSGTEVRSHTVRVDSLVGHPTVVRTQTIAWTETQAILPEDQPVGFMLALAASGDLDSVYVSAHVSMDGVGYKVIQRTLLDPSEGTTAAALTVGYEVMEIPAGKLKGWNKLRFQFNNYDRSHDAAVALTAYHNYALQQPIPDWDETR